MKVEIDLELLDLKYYQLIARVHPDAAAANPEVLAGVSAEQINTAYNTLKNEDSRLEYLVDIQGVKTDIKVDDIEFLMKFLQYQESLEAIFDDYQKLKNFKKQIVDERNVLVQQIKSQISNKLYDSAQMEVAKLNFYRRILQHIEQKEEQLDEAI